ncbi:DUF1579 family protein [uncultured Erythrobacter sp.]|uniref:DUF1579 family protein n=1 Tax=uncultured Erythrobacter sp. TaxID=263913 RepID=UPI00261461F6|nr:DUF1579 family protein [uncultured Erythrobacter sp.]
MTCRETVSSTVNNPSANGAWLAFALAVLLAAFQSSAAHAEEIVQPRIEEFQVDANPPMEDFSMLAGNWSVESRSVKDRLAPEKVWVRNRMQTEYRILLDGLVAINDTFGTFNGRPMHGIMIRTYDPTIDEWNFQWMSKGYPHLTPQVRGGFENGVGIFYGTEDHGGRTFQMRFRWKMISADHAFWEQSYLNPETGVWEPNWTLDLTRSQQGDAASRTTQ